MGDLRGPCATPQCESFESIFWGADNVDGRQVIRHNRRFWQVVEGQKTGRQGYRNCLGLYLPLRTAISQWILAESGALAFCRVQCAMCGPKVLC